MLQIKNLSVSYGAIEAVKNISLTVNDGEIVSLIGANGAGQNHDIAYHHRSYSGGFRRGAVQRRGPARKRRTIRS